MRRGQAFSMDFLAAVVIFMLVLGLVLYSWNYIVEGSVRSNQRRGMEISAARIADFLATTGGYPYNWEEKPENATTIGLAGRDRVIDNRKLAAFMGMGDDAFKQRMNIAGYGFYFRILGQGIVKGSPPDGSVASTIRRVVIYNSTPETLEFSIWRYA